jgi:hypothetical protein
MFAKSAMAALGAGSLARAADRGGIPVGCGTDLLRRRAECRKHQAVNDREARRPGSLRVMSFGGFLGMGEEEHPILRNLSPATQTIVP